MCIEYRLSYVTSVTELPDVGHLLLLINNDVTFLFCLNNAEHKTLMHSQDSALVRKISFAPRGVCVCDYVKLKMPNWLENESSLLPLPSPKTTNTLRDIRVVHIKGRDSDISIYYENMTSQKVKNFFIRGTRSRNTTSKWVIWSRHGPVCEKLISDLPVHMNDVSRFNSFL